MPDIKKCILLFVVVNFVCVCSARIGQRRMHFPGDRLVGKLFVQDANFQRRLDGFHYWGEDVECWEFLCNARGTVLIPAGKHVKLITSSSIKLAPSDLAGLGPDDLHTLVLRTEKGRRRRINNRIVSSIAGLSGLRSLDIQTFDISSGGLARLEGLERLERLHLGESFTDFGVRAICELKSLKGLYLRSSRISDDGVKKICENLSLEELNLSCKRLSDACLVHLSEMGRLRYLMLGGTTFTDAGMKHVADIESLKILHIGPLRNITAAGVKELSRHKGIEVINFHWNENIGNQAAIYLSRMPSLKMLDLWHASVDDEGLAHLSNCGTLEHLDLPRVNITDVGLKHLSKLKSLRHLSVRRGVYVDPKKDINHYTDKGLEYISSLSNLEELHIGGTGVTDAGMSHIAKLTGLKKLTISSPITDKGIEKLLSLKSLTFLDMYRPRITVTGLNKLNRLTGLEYLRIGNIKKDGTVLDLSQLKKLEKLTLSTPHKSPEVLVDADLACLAELDNLKSFVIPGAIDTHSKNITGEGLKYLCGLANLEQVIIGGPNLRDVDFKYFGKMNNLKTLGVSGGNLTDGCLKHLENLRYLGSLRIYKENDITDRALSELDAKMPNLTSITIYRNENTL